MEKDPVCGMQVDPAKAAATSQYQGKTYYFCAQVCKTKFDANPADQLVAVEPRHAEIQQQGIRMDGLDSFDGLVG